ncbi:hypothetical protein [Rhodococcus sovatensis]|uniref:Uncharacterized protein n=1 Tax=Rhodococcus sovatensis TaxID=1805840 RepID=A0ABZ2PTI1_9NOCA
MKNFVRKIPFPFVGYVLMLLGFICLGMFVYSMAIDGRWAPALGILVIAAFASCVGCFYVRALQISMTADGDGDGWILNNDPFQPDREQDGRELYLHRYR